MNHIGTVPMRTRPLSYQPLRAGQFRGYGGCNVFPSRTTIVNNNIYGGYGYDSGCCGGYDNGGMSKGMKWMMGLGITLPLVGSILSALGLGGGKKVEDGQGGEQPPANDQSDLIKDLTKQVENLTATVEDLKNGKKAPEVKEPPTAEVKEEKPAVEDPAKTIKIDLSKFKDGEIMECIDGGNGIRPISGTLSNVKRDTNGVPQSFTITDTSENKKGNTYEYVLASTADDGTPTYKCVKKNNQAVIGEQVYAFKDGKLVQENDKFAGFGIGIKTQAPVQTTTKVETAPPPLLARPSEETLTDKTSNQFSLETPFFNFVDGQYHSTADQGKKSTPTNIGKNAVADAYNKITSKRKTALSKADVLAELNKMSAADKKSLADQLTKAGYGEFL